MYASTLRFVSTGQPNLAPSQTKKISLSHAASASVFPKAVSNTSTTGQTELYADCKRGLKYVYRVLLHYKSNLI